VLIAEHFCDGIDVQFLSCAAAAALVAAAEAAFQAPQTLEHRLDCTGTLQARLEIFGTTQHFLCPHSRLFRASRSYWQDVLCDDLVRTPSTQQQTAKTAAAAAAAAYTIPLTASARRVQNSAISTVALAVSRLVCSVLGMTGNRLYIPISSHSHAVNSHSFTIAFQV